MISLNKIKSSLSHRLRYQTSPLLSSLFSSIGRGKYGHGPRLTYHQPILDLGILVEQVNFDIEDCRNFWEKLTVQSQILHQLVYNQIFWQKIPQYYFTWKSLEFILTNPQKVYIDIASTGKSPYQEVLKLLAKTPNIYFQDLIFPRGINGNLIGGSAAALPLSDLSVDGMTLNCAFEHFEGDADIGFIREAGRVLRPSGRVCIVPLYMGEYAFVLCDPAWEFNLSVEQEELIHFFPQWGERHGRFYSPETLLKRIIEPAKKAGLKAKVIYFKNIRDIDPAAYTHFALILDKV
jgi:SAM-dependent methyltransferase